MNAEELAYRRTRHAERMYESNHDGGVMRKHRTGVCEYDGDDWPCDTAEVLAHLDALTAAVEELAEPRRSAHPSEDHMLGYRECAQSVLALLRGDTKP